MKILNKIAEILTVVIIIVLIISVPVMVLWNWLMPDIFGLPQITFWQAIGISLLTTILFKNSDTGK